MQYNDGDVLICNIQADRKSTFIPCDLNDEVIVNIDKCPIDGEKQYFLIINNKRYIYPLKKYELDLYFRKK